VCNFACQTCWPAASSRVAQFHAQAGLIDIKNINSTAIDDFEFLLPIAPRIKNLVLLGGEPFYDKSCKKFLEWAKANLSANLMMFTNGSEIDFDFLTQYPGKLTLIFSLDATGRPAEYVRYGTEWSQVLKNYQQVRDLKNIDIRVNITCSVYNYAYIEQLIEFLCQDWPDVVTFGIANSLHFLESVVPLDKRQQLIESLQRAVLCLEQANIESGQKSNAINAITSNIQNLKTTNWDQDNYTKLCDFIERMDRVKNIKLQDYCPEIHTMLQQ
jgi:sulfatase maturation enzyme AslB (radical SAM superfamily)